MPRTQLDSDGSERRQRSLRQTEIDTWFGQREKENENDPQLFESRLERNIKFVSFHPLYYVLQIDDDDNDDE